MSVIVAMLCVSGVLSVWGAEGEGGAMEEDPECNQCREHTAHAMGSLCVSLHLLDCSDYKSGQPYEYDHPVKAGHPTNYCAKCCQNLVEDTDKQKAHCTEKLNRYVGEDIGQGTGSAAGASMEAEEEMGIHPPLLAGPRRMAKRVRELSTAEAAALEEGAGRYDSVGTQREVSAVESHMIKSPPEDDLGYFEKFKWLSDKLMVAKAETASSPGLRTDKQAVASARKRIKSRSEVQQEGGGSMAGQSDVENTPGAERIPPIPEPQAGKRTSRPKIEFNPEDDHTHDGTPPGLVAMALDIINNAVDTVQAKIMGAANRL